MRVAGFIALIIFSPTVAHAGVLINEVAWMGTTASANAEWIELVNTDAAVIDITGWRLLAASGSPDISLAGTIAPGGYFLLERTSDASVPEASADLVYTGALTNTGATLTLSDTSGTTVDQVVGGTNWANIGGDNATKETAQRTTSGWQTAAATPRTVNVGGVSSPSATPTISSSTPVAAPAESPSGGGPTEYLPIPTLRIVAAGDRNVSSGADTAFTAAVYDSKGNRRDDALVTWSFGDGMRRTGANVFHAYYEPGEYVVIVHVTTVDGGDALARSIVTAKNADVSIASVTPRGVSLSNSGTRTLDLSLWRIQAGGKEFKIPEDTHILAGHTILFPSQVIDLPFSGVAELLYPSGEVAAVYPKPVPLPQQPFTPITSFNTVQKVSPITSTERNIQTHEDAVVAPTAQAEPAAVGAVAAVSEAPIAGKETGIFRSPWTLGLLGVILLAGSAFILL